MSSHQSHLNVFSTLTVQLNFISFQMLCKKVHKTCKCKLRLSHVWNWVSDLCENEKGKVSELNHHPHATDAFRHDGT